MKMTMSAKVAAAATATLIELLLPNFTMLVTAAGLSLGIFTRVLRRCYIVGVNRTDSSAALPGGTPVSGHVSRRIISFH